MKQYKWQALSGREAIDLSGRRMLPLGLVAVPLRDGKPIFVQNLKKSTAFGYRRALEKIVARRIDVSAQRVNGFAGYVFSVHEDASD